MKHIKRPLTYHRMSGAHDRIDDGDHVPIADCWIPGVAREIVLTFNAHDALVALAHSAIERLGDSFYSDDVRITEMARAALALLESPCTD